MVVLCGGGGGWALLAVGITINFPGYPVSVTQHLLF